MRSTRRKCYFILFTFWFYILLLLLLWVFVNSIYYYYILLWFSNYCLSTCIILPSVLHIYWDPDQRKYQYQYWVSARREIKMDNSSLQYCCKLRFTTDLTDLTFFWTETRFTSECQHRVHHNLAGITCPGQPYLIKKTKKTKPKSFSSTTS